MLKSTLLGCVFTLASILTAASVKAADDDDTKLNNEARNLFRTVLSDHYQDCALDANWNTDTIPESVAREYLGLKVHADLSAPATTALLKDILGSSTVGAAAFCNQDDRKNWLETRIKAFEKSSEDSFEVNLAHYTFPVFDDAFQTAVFVVTYETLKWQHLATGIQFMEPLSSGHAVIYIKEQGVWYFLKSIRLFIT